MPDEEGALIAAHLPAAYRRGRPRPWLPPALPASKRVDTIALSGDLQFIRRNGTILDGTIGLLLLG
jgi:hypothetical protein